LRSISGRKAPRPLLVLRADGSYDSIEHDARVKLVAAALVSGEAVTADRFALEHAGWVNSGTEAHSFPAVRCDFRGYTVHINGKLVEEEHLRHTLSLAYSPKIDVLCSVAVSTPTPENRNRKTPFTVPGGFTRTKALACEYESVQVLTQTHKTHYSRGCCIDEQRAPTALQGGSAQSRQ